MTESRKLTLPQHIDPAHGWLAVPRALIEELGIARHISVYSYEGPDCTVYLEEDDDAPVFIAAAMDAGWDLHFTIQETDEPSPIRRLPRYKGGRSCPFATAPAPAPSTCSSANVDTCPASPVGSATPHADGEGFDLTFSDKPNPHGELLLRAEQVKEAPHATAVPADQPYRGHLRKHSQAKLYYKLLYPYPGEVFDDDRIEYQWHRAFAHACFTEEDWKLLHRFL
jgi:hypothetical protein